MGIFTRVKEMATADMNHMLDRMEDPIRMAKQYIRQVEEQLDQTRQALLQQLTAEQRYDKMIARSEEMAVKRLRQAELAIEREEESIAEMAVQDKLYHQQMIEEYELQREVIRQNVKALREQIVQLTDMHQDLLNRLFFLESRIHAAQSMKTASSVVGSLDMDRLTRGFTRVEERVRNLETGQSIPYYGSPGFQAQGKLDEFEAQERVKAELNKLKENKGQ